MSLSVFPFYPYVANPSRDNSSSVMANKDNNHTDTHIINLNRESNPYEVPF